MWHKAIHYNRLHAILWKYISQPIENKRHTNFGEMLELLIVRSLRWLADKTILVKSMSYE